MRSQRFHIGLGLAALGLWLALGALGCSDPGEPGSAPAGTAATGSGQAAEDEISHWTCPMHPSVHAKHAGKCPICGMALVPVLRREIESGEIRIDAERRERVGIRTVRVERGVLDLGLRAVGRVTADETRLVDVSVKVRGWVAKLEVGSLGAPVGRGDVLFLFYSPELYATQQELLQALKSQATPGAGGTSGRSDVLVRAARKRLELWNVAAVDIDAIARRGEPRENLPIRSPASGFVIQKNVAQGAAVEPGALLYRIAPLDRVWIDAAVQESDLGLVSIGQPARVSLPSLPDASFEGSVAYVYPSLDPETRTGRIRIELPNPDHRLLPDMFANVDLKLERGDQVLVPASAVLYAGPRRVVFVDLGEGRLAPRTIEIGAGNGEFYEVLSGLEPGETVVSSGNFLVASESRLRSALPQ